MTLSDPDPRLSLAYSGHHDGVRFTCAPARYGKGMVLSLQNDVLDMWKNRAAWLAEALNGHWARGHQEGFRLSNTRAVQWKILYLAGWDANVPMFKSVERPVTFSLNNGPEMSLKEALKQIAEPTDLDRAVDAAATLSPVALVAAVKETVALGS